MTQKPPPQPENAPSRGDSVSAFALDLAELRRSAGSPTLDTLAGTTGVSKSVLSDAFAARRLPTENTVRRLTEALGADHAEWVTRRLALDPRSAAPAADDPPRGVPREGAASARPSALARPVSLGVFLLGIAATAIVSIACSTLIGWSARTAPAEPAVAASAEPSYLPYADGVDPMQTVCREDAVLAGGDKFLDGQALIEMMYSNRCMAVWGRVTRYDGKGSGNTLSVRIYPRSDPESSRDQERTDTDVQSLYTTLMIEPDVNARVCGVATVTVDGVATTSTPVCI
ncbi:helix-turn-helix transcriptional regulator [Microbacterium sp. SORGH_AS_0888]|uniref:helix-turn-helix domain-containing protein n=1 Tax=Microbacterium sp. SORGH_AS_0888 TaxID=3041791 RepID=UPI0027869273|nr:helix-turn-helix transcriptional regulator [Microbacterium sp. SORGH_AS_0888]MDQ1131362.1 transcriptional regulator with XRE-family HTH domain [Microbacterium sp. SORGH_AS_0888]